MTSEDIVRGVQAMAPDLGDEVFDYVWERKTVALDRVRYAGEMPDEIAKAIHYADEMEAGAVYPPIVVIYRPDGEFDYELEDGRHRAYAAARLGKTELMAYVGTHKELVGLSREVIIELARLFQEERGAFHNQDAKRARELAAQRIEMLRRMSQAKHST